MTAVDAFMAVFISRALATSKWKRGFKPTVSSIRPHLQRIEGEVSLELEAAGISCRDPGEEYTDSEMQILIGCFKNMKETIYPRLCHMIWVIGHDHIRSLRMIRDLKLMKIMRRYTTSDQFAQLHRKFRTLFDYILNASRHPSAMDGSASEEHIECSSTSTTATSKKLVGQLNQCGKRAVVEQSADRHSSASDCRTVRRSTFVRKRL